MASEPRSSCPIACTLDLVGDRWTLVILRDLLFAGRSRFSEFAVAENIAPNILSERLSRLEEAGMVTRRPDPEDRRRKIYRPTPMALDMIPVLVEVGRWGVSHTCGRAHADLFVAAAGGGREEVLAQLRARAQSLIPD